MSNLPWVEKYRPESLDDVIAHKDIISTLRHLLNSNRLPHLLFYGPPGTGKTSTIVAIAKHLYKEHYSRMTLELNASDERGIDVVREKIKDFAATGVLFSSGHKLIILDEADQMTRDAQSALRRIVEKYTSNVRFCLICNNVNKIIPAIQSRCTRFRFGPLPTPAVRECLDRIIISEGVEADASGRDALVSICGGDMRRVLNVLQSTVLSFGVVNASNVYSTTGQPDPMIVTEILNSLLQEDIRVSVQKLEELSLNEGISLLDILQAIHDKVVHQDWPPSVKCFILKELAGLEVRLNMGANESIQGSGLAGVFMIARETVGKIVDGQEESMVS
ncbi:hypothetical protein GEMRC1_001014 [Eukaryota sp. GEM-RC1]